MDNTTRTEQGAVAFGYTSGGVQVPILVDASGKLVTSGAGSGFWADAGSGNISYTGGATANTFLAAATLAIGGAAAVSGSTIAGIRLASDLNIYFINGTTTTNISALNNAKDTFVPLNMRALSFLFDGGNATFSGALGVGSVTSFFGTHANVYARTQYAQAGIFQAYNNDEIDIMQNAYYDGSFKRMGAGGITCGMIAMYTSAIDFNVADASTAGSTITWKNAMKITSAGLVTIPNYNVLIGNPVDDTYTILNISRSVAGGGLYMKIANPGAGGAALFIAENDAVSWQFGCSTLEAFSMYNATSGKSWFRLDSDGQLHLKSGMTISYDLS